MYVGKMQENFINVFTCSLAYMRLEIQCNMGLVNKPYLSLCLPCFSLCSHLYIFIHDILNVIMYLIKHALMFVAILCLL